DGYRPEISLSVYFWTPLRSRSFPPETTLPAQKRPPHRPASPLRYSLVSSSNLSFNAESSLKSIAERLSLSWSARLAPRITEVMTGLARTHAIERTGRDTPCSF